MPTNPQPVRTSYPAKSIAKVSLSVLRKHTIKLDPTYFWAHEFRSTTERACCATIPHVLLAETIISNFDVTIHGQQNVIELQITVDDTVLVEVLKCQADLGGIEPKICEHFQPPKQGKDLSIGLTVLS